MTDTALKAEAISATGSQSTAAGVSTDVKPVSHQITTDKAKSALQLTQTTRGVFALGGLLLGCGIALWVAGTQGAAYELVSILGLIGAVLVGAVTLQQALGGVSVRRDEHDVLSLLPLAGLFLVSLSTVCQFFVGDVEPHPEVSAAPLILGSIYLFLRAFSARGWASAGTRWTPLFPPGSAQQSVLVPGERLSLAAGDVAPVDCRVQAGSISVQERYLSPVARFRVKDETELVFAGSSIVGGSAECVALTASKDSCLRRLEAAVDSELSLAEDVYRKHDEYLSRLYAYAVLFCSIAAAISWNERTGSPTAVVSAAGLVLFAGSLGIVVDLIYSSYARLIRQWARRGYVLLSEQSCEDLAKTSEVHFDPSTIGGDSICTVREVDLLDDRINRDALCGTLLSILGRADDVALVAFADYCAQFAVSTTPERVLDLREYEGWGICGSIKGIEFSIGSEGFLVERGIMVQPSDNIASTQANERTILVAIDYDVIARCVVSFGQQHVASADGAHSVWADCHDVEPRVASLESREFPADALLVRGNESEALVRSHSVVATWLSKDSLRPPKATVLLLTNSLRELPELLTECRENLKWARLCRALVVTTGLVMIAAVFIGLVTPIVPAVMLPLVTLLVLI
jgi:cation transport ATPase